MYLLLVEQCLPTSACLLSLSGPSEFAKFLQLAKKNEVNDKMTGISKHLDFTLSVLNKSSLMMLVTFM